MFLALIANRSLFFPLSIHPASDCALSRNGHTYLLIYDNLHNFIYLTFKKTTNKKSYSVVQSYTVPGPSNSDSFQHARVTELA